MFKPGDKPLPPKHAGEVLPVPPEMIPQVWKKVRYVFGQIPGYQIERTHTRLLVGMDRLWLGVVEGAIRGVIVTSISPRPPKRRKCFWRDDPALMKSLTIHFAGGPKYQEKLLSWLPSAIERIGAYAREQGCHQLFLLSRIGWQRFLMRRWWSREWEVVAFSRDRPTRSTCKAYRERNKPGYFRPLVPVARDQFSRHRYRIVGTAYFPHDQEAA